MVDETEYSARSLLQFAIDVLNEAERASHEGLSIIPVMFLDSMEAVSPVLDACFRHANVKVVDAEDQVDGITVRSPVKAALIARIEALTSNFGDVSKRVVVDVDGRDLQVRFEGEGTPTNPGSRNFLGVLTALLDPSLDRQAHAVLRYDEMGMSQNNREELWNLLVHELRGFYSTLTTLTVITSSPEVEPARHYGVDSGVLWVFDSGQILHRQRPEQDRDRIGRLAAGSKPLILMLGAGASRSSNLPQGNELRDEALKRRMPNSARNGDSVIDLARRFYGELRDAGRLMDGEDNVHDFVQSLTLERVLREEAHYCAPDEEMETLVSFRSRETRALAAPGPAILSTRELLKLRGRIVLMTVNFDRLIESGVNHLRGMEDEESEPGPGEPPSVRTFVDPAEFAQFPDYYAHYAENGGAVPLLKLHGTIDRVDTVRATVDVTYPGLDQAASDALRALLPPAGQSNSWIYVGCSMRDRDITPVIGTRQFAERTNEHWVSPSIDPNVEAWVANHRAAAWRSAQLADTLLERSITQTADSFLEQLAAWLLPSPENPWTT